MSIQKRILWEAARLFSGCIAAAIVLYTIFIRIVFFFLPDSTTINQKVVESDLRFTVLMLFFITAIGWYASYKLKRVALANLLKLERAELFTLTVSAIFLSYFLTKSFSIFEAFRSISFIFIASLMFYVLGQILTLLMSYGTRDISLFLEHLEETQKDSRVRRQTIRTLFIGVSLIFIAYIIFVSIRATYKSLTYRQVYHEKLYIDSVTPDRTTYAYKVTLNGYNFGPEYNRARQVLRSSYGPVLTDFWSENRIVFTVPLYWKVGRVELWIERPNKYEEKRIEKSNVASMTVLNRWDYFPTAQDAAPARIIKRVVRTAYLDFWNNFAARAEIEQFGKYC